MSKKQIKSPKRKNKTIRIIFLIITCIIVIILASLLIKKTNVQHTEGYQNNVKNTSQNITKLNYTFRCDQEFVCENCSVFVSCLDYNDENHYLYFRIKNQNNQDGNCFINFYVKKEEKTLINKTYDIGKIEKNRKKDFRILVDFPIGLIDFGIVPSCNWHY